VLGEILSLLRDKDVLYDNSTSLRRKGLVGRFDRAELQGKGLRGVLVHIPQSPFEVPRNFERSVDWPERARRAIEVLHALEGESETEWEALTKASRGVKTNLSRLGPERTANVLRHGYLLAMANCHVILGYPLVAVPPRGRFLGMAT
jgi:hypothetical protein